MTDSRSQFDPLETLTVKEVAELLHVSRPTVVKHIKSGELPSVQIGRCRRVRRRDLEDFLEIRWTRHWQSYKPQASQYGDGYHVPEDSADGSDEILF